MESLSGSRTDADNDSHLAMTPLRTVVLQRLEVMMATCNHLDIAANHLTTFSLAVWIFRSCRRGSMRMWQSYTSIFVLRYRPPVLQFVEARNTNFMALFVTQVEIYISKGNRRAAIPS